MFTIRCQALVCRVCKSVMSHRKKILAGMQKAAEKGRFPGRPVTVSDAKIRKAIPLGTAAGARAVGLSKSQFLRRRYRLEYEPYE